MFPVLYFLSLGPATWLEAHVEDTPMAESASLLFGLYGIPYQIVVNSFPFVAEPIGWYAEWWLPDGP